MLMKLTLNLIFGTPFMGSFRDSPFKMFSFLLYFGIVQIYCLILTILIVMTISIVLLLTKVMMLKKVNEYFRDLILDIKLLQKKTLNFKIQIKIVLHFFFASKDVFWRFKKCTVIFP